ncbi:unnamed protein product [Paramecium octaurelia]|uniref:Uncharacterized protein n=1 Tax=Paramecium octaurelia TaxID=43137 RepID=A0A8S1VW49_PAROT|nr:unnamed protein product [Paramecium octaurelia]
MMLYILSQSIRWRQNGCNFFKFLIEECLLQIPLTNYVIIFCWNIRNSFAMFQKKYEQLVITDSGKISMALYKIKRKEFQENRIDNHLKRKLKIMASVYQIRINFIMKNIRNQYFRFVLYVQRIALNKIRKIIFQIQ